MTYQTNNLNNRIFKKMKSQNNSIKLEVLEERVCNMIKTNNLYRFKKGYIPWNKNKKTGLIPKTAFKKGGHIGAEFKKGNVPWNKGKHTGVSPWLGKKFSKETKKKLSESHKGINTWSKGKSAFWNKGNKSHLWKGGITPINKTERMRFKNTIQKLILERDNYTCRLCGIKGITLQVDHIQPWAEYIEGRFSMDNCRTLCTKCHYKITFGKEMPETIKSWGLTFKERGYCNV